MNRAIKLLLGASVAFLVIHTIACGAAPNDQSQIVALVQLQLKHLHAGDWVSVYATCNPVFRARYQRTPDEVEREFTRGLQFLFGATPAGIDLRNPRVVPTRRDGDYVVVETGRGYREYSPISEGEIIVMEFDAYEHGQLVANNYWKPFAKVDGKWYDHGPACR